MIGGIYMTHTEIKELLEQYLPFWTQLTSLQKNMLVSGTKNNLVPKGHTIHYQEQGCAGVILLLHGSLRTYITSEEGREITLYRLSDHDVCILSASCVLENIEFDVFVEAESDTEILQINSCVFSKVSSENVYAELFSYKLATLRFSDVMWAMQQILFTSFDKRLAAFLIEESDKSKSMTLLTTHEQIAKYLGSAREVVSRMLSYFAKEGYVTLSRGSITIKNKSALRAYMY